MDVVKAVETYIAKLVSTPSAMKVLLLDAHTTPIVSLAATQSTLLSHQVYLTDRVDNPQRNRMAHMKCVCFLQPSEESIAAVSSELREPKYGDYYLCQLQQCALEVTIERLAEADEFEVVREVQVHSFCACGIYYSTLSSGILRGLRSLLPSLFSLNHIPSEDRPLYGSSPNTWDEVALGRSVQGIIAKPVIRYEKMSGMAKKLANEVHLRIQSESTLFDFRPAVVSPLLIILDRRNDPVTPLLTQWTYQAMVHELLGVHNGRVNLSMVPDIGPELSEITLTTSTDPFFQAHHLATFGDLGTSLKNYVQSYQSRSLAQSPSAINSISDMKRFVEEFPEFRKLGGNVSKHVALVGELSRLVERDRLLDVGEVEQGLATSAGCDLKTVQALVTDNAVSAWNKLRVTGNIAALINLLLANGVSKEEARLVYVLLNIAGSDQRQDDLFSTESLLAKGKSALKGLKGVENVYTQHTPHLSQTLENLLKGRLKESSYPFLEGYGTNLGLQRPQDIIIFIVGGTTYEEARTVALLNQEANNAGTQILLGGTCVHNSSSYVEMIRVAAKNFPPSVYEPPPESASNAPSLNLNLGGVNVSLGAEGIKDGVRSLFDKVRQGVDKIGFS
ncbi:Sec1-like protein [Pisolithus tinctorius]|nr:Sec1-like protein [Pisolithus tinctorius]